VTSSDWHSVCLNCGTALQGRFCSHCGQRVIPRYPSVRQLIGDTWQELSGYDGRFVRTFRVLLRRPGALTLDVLEGRRARYVSPVRLYLVASVLYFVIAAAAPNLRTTPRSQLRGSTVTVDLGRVAIGTAQITPEERDQVLRSSERAPWWLRDILRSVVLDPSQFRARVVANLPRVLFALVPLFAAIVSVFYRRRPFTQHLVFALHLHTVVFITLGVRELTNFTQSLVFVGIAQVLAALFILAYALIGFRMVYGDSWGWIVGKLVGIAGVYFFAGLCAMLGIIVWAALA
jgi:hypothetical protein